MSRSADRSKDSMKTIAVFQEEGEEMLMSLDGPNYDSKIDGGARSAEVDMETESSDEDGEISDGEEAQSLNNNATVHVPEKEDSDDELLEEFE